MTRHRSTAHRARRLFLGSAFAALSASLAAPALAIPPSLPQIEAEGAQVIANNQSRTDTAVEAVAADPVIEAVIEPTQANATLSGNSVTASATANRQDSTLVSDTLDLSTMAIDTYLAADADGITADAPAVIAVQQTMEDAPVTADADFTYVGITADGVVESSLAIAANRQEALATGNDAASTISISGNDGSTGAGLASRQSTGYGSDVSANMAGVSRIITQEVVNSDLAMDGNLQRAIATGNSAANALSTDVLSIEGTSASGTPSLVTPYGGPEVNAAYALLSDQQTGSEVSAGADGGFRSVAVDSVVGSSMSADGNALAAAAYGNEAQNNVLLTANSIDAGYGALANVTNVQAAGGATSADTLGGTTMFLSSDLMGSTISAAGNSVQAIAIANRADANLLSVIATSTSAPDGYGGEEGGEWPEGPEYVGTARLTPFGEMTVTAPFSVQNAQSFAAPVTASASQDAARVTAEAGIIDSSVAVLDNDTRVAATGNRGTNGLMVDANSIATAADLNSSQLGFGDVRVTVADSDDLAGARIAAQGDVVGSRLTVAGNSTQGTAIANDVTNSLGVAGNQLVSASGHWDAVAGLASDDLVASADYALANYQSTGMGLDPGEGEGGGIPQISSDVTGRLAGVGNSIIGSSVAIEGNSQTATVLANLASNDLSINATSLGSNFDIAPGTALSSTQIGIADLAATSDLMIDATGYVVDGSVGIADNSNGALAHMNDAVNQASIDAVQIWELSGAGAELFTDPGLPGLAVGDHVLANSQLADGGVAAVAQTGVGNIDEGAVLSRSSYALTGNSTATEAVANQAINGLSVSAASRGEASAGLANTQESHAGVLASAVTQLGYAGEALSDAQVLVDGNTTSAAARGNVASNSLMLSGTPTYGAMPANASLTGSGAVSAAAGLANSQLNTGDVTALSENAGHDVVLNAVGAEGSKLILNGNSVSASAVGNSATNNVTLASLGKLPTAAVANIQMNSGQISAWVSGATFHAIPGALTASRLGITGNSVAASAVGNSAVTSIASPR
ncbi:MAG: hypothetical protein B7Z20_01325 [Sphingobium sp. 32-64-5]|nr:MAG: hypothetical protein B7Z20_01325 [Sphingobium sp. 32-64-5]|tara:strand:- start:18640 stop:21738 length:3099 start_codon:yes stop_codon:yes gene_type:complete